MSDLKSARIRNRLRLNWGIGAQKHSVCIKEAVDSAFVNGEDYRESRVNGSKSRAGSAACGGIA